MGDRETNHFAFDLLDWPDLTLGIKQRHQVGVGIRADPGRDVERLRDRDQAGRRLDLGNHALRLRVWRSTGRKRGDLREFRRPDARTIPDVLRSEPRSVPTARQVLGEAVSYAADGRSYLLGAEGVGSSLVRVECRAR